MTQTSTAANKALSFSPKDKSVDAVRSNQSLTELEGVDIEYKRLGWKKKDGGQESYLFVSFKFKKEE